MYRADGRWVVSASDLVGYLECEHLNGLSMAHALGGLDPPSLSSDDDALDVVRRRGYEHERRYLDSLHAEGRSIVEIPEARTVEELRIAAGLTRQAIGDGVDVIFQATFFDEAGPLSWRGHADFLERDPDVKSDTGSAVYEPVDTKLARSVKPAAVLQLCQYASQLTEVQQHEPRLLHIELGDGERASFRYASVAAYYRHARRRFESAILAGPKGATYPDPVSHCSVCMWAQRCDQQRRDDDHLTLVARLGRDHVRKFVAAGVPNVAELARTTITSVPRMGLQVFDSFRRQAQLQVDARGLPAGVAPPFALIEPSGSGRGLEGLPVPSAGDLYLDLEGDPYVGVGGLEYLFGIGWLDASGGFQFTPFWGHDDAGERAAFESAVDFIVERRRAHPDLHVYHYASYERTAFGRLMGKYGTREDEVDDLLRGRVLVDLFRVVRQGVRVGVESYSIKKLEPLYMAPRDAAITDAGSSIVEYERWLETRDPQILHDIEHYNRDDCESTWRLHHWLEAHRADAELQFARPLERPNIPDPSNPLDTTTDVPVDLHARLAGDLRGPPDRSSTEYARWVLAHLLEWHRREDKPVWWRYFDIVSDYAPGDLFDDGGCLDLLDYVGVDRAEKQSLLHRYRFDPEQEHKIKVGDRPPDPAVERDVLRLGADRVSPGEVVEIDPIAGELVLKRKADSAAVHPVALMDHNVIGTTVLREAIARVAEWSAANGIEAPGRYRAVRDLLLGVAPRIEGVAAGDALRLPGEDAVVAATRLVGGLDHSCLPIQGPPGTGKTFTSAHVVVDLIAAGKRVGITANSHAVITNLLDEVMRVAAARDVVVTAMQRVDDGGSAHPDVECVDDSRAVEAALAAGDVKLVAGTAWLFARPGMEESLDHLFVDEAGQMSLANVVAVGTATRNLVLVGDPQQLPQPTKGTHPVGAGVAALEHLLDGRDTMPPERGLFLETSFRMHPDISTFVSELSYENRLSSVAECARQRVLGEGTYSGRGLRWLPVEHTGNKLSSDEEAIAVARCYASLVGRRWIDANGVERPITADDVLVVAPYNAQVHAIGRVLPAGARVGTVDKFQGQEGAVVIVSMAASSAADAPRGLEFLLSTNRLNVAISRARALAIVVASPTLLTTECKSLHQIQLVNGLCRFAELHVANPTDRDESPA